MLLSTVSAVIIKVSIIQVGETETVERGGGKGVCSAAIYSHLSRYCSYNEFMTTNVQQNRHLFSNILTITTSKCTQTLTYYINSQVR